MKIKFVIPLRLSTTHCFSIVLQRKLGFKMSTNEKLTKLIQLTMLRRNFAYIKKIQ